MKILITGASSGIGFLTGIVLGERGHEVYMTTKTLEEEKNLKEKIKKLDLNIKVFKLDITGDQDKINSLDLDVLFLHAGVGYTGLLENIDLNLVRDNFEINVFANLSMIQTFLKSNNKPKKVIMTSSLIAKHSYPFFGSYIMTKSCIELMMKILRVENSFNNNKFIVIKPGAYHTGFNQFMILSGEKSNLNLKIRNVLNRLFLFIEEKDIRSIVYKIILAIEKSDHNTYSAPFIQTLLSKLTF